MCEVYDLCVVGAGLIGSAAARHASLHPGVKVMLIGPDEPEVRQGHSIFGAYFDEARITSQLNPRLDPTWTNLQQDSIRGFKTLQEASGMQFMREVGCIHISDDKDMYPALKDSLQDPGLEKDIKVLQPQEARKIFPYLRVRQGDVAIYEGGVSGFINPRKLRLAQQMVARQQDCSVLNDVVACIQQVEKDGKKLHAVITEKGHCMMSHKVLLCTGAFTSFRKLLPRDLEPEVSLFRQAVVFAEIGPADLAKLRNMPSIVAMVEFDPNCPDDDKVSMYCLPPIQYPDGKYYLKLGHLQQFERVLHTEHEVADWYTNPVPTYIQEGLRGIFHGTFPHLQPLSYHYDSCVTTNTPEKRPYVDLVTPSIGVVLGGNGMGACTSDQLGKLGALLVLTGHWGYDNIIPHSQVKFRCKNKRSSQL